MNQKTFEGALRIGMTLVVALSSCVVQPLTKQTKAEVWQRKDPETPQLLVRSYYGTPDQVKALVTELGDVVRPVRKWARQGNGAVSLRFVDEQGRSLRTVESGGHLVVEGQPGQAYAIRIRNETDVKLEVLPIVDGLDLETGLEAELRRAGKMLGPRDDVAFGGRSGTGGKEEVLRFRGGEGVTALHRWNPSGTVGSVVLAIFVGQGEDSFDDRPVSERVQPMAIGNQGSFPQRRTEPMRIPYQYR